MKNSFLHSFLVATIIIVLFFMTIPVASAAGVQIDPSYHPQNAPTITGEAAETEKNLTVEQARVQFFARIINVILGIVGIIAVFSLINNAWWMTASAGQEEALTQHKKGLKWAVIGLILVILSYSIMRWIVSITWQAHETPTATTETFEKMSIPEGKLEPDSTPSVEELQQMDKDEYFQQQSQSDYKINDQQFKGTQPDIKSEGLLEFESETYQSKEKLHIGEEPAVPNEGKFTLPPMK